MQLQTNSERNPGGDPSILTIALSGKKAESLGPILVFS